MDMDRIKGKAQSAFGKAEEAVGEAVGSEDLSNAGMKDRIAGDAKDTWGNVKDTARSISDTADTRVVRDRADAEYTGKEHAANFREKVADKVEDIKESFNNKMDDMKEDQRIRREEIRRSA